MTAAAALVADLRRELNPVREQLLAHPYVAAVEAGLVEPDGLRAFAGEQYHIISSDVRSVAHLVSRFGGGFFLGVLDGERAALDALAPLAAGLRMDAADLEAYEPHPGAHAYAAYMAWLAAYGSAGQVAGAYLVNFAAWGENCARLSRALRERYGLTTDQVRFFDQFAEPLGDFEDRALEVIADDLRAGTPEAKIRRAARLLQGYELLYWDTLVAELQR